MAIPPCIRTRRRSLRRSRERRGVLLLIVVACIVIAGLAMIGITRQSLRMATDSVQDEIELQQRWGAVSLQRTLLKGAPAIFAESDRQSLLTGNRGPFRNAVRSQMMLGGINFDLLLADEQAKLNLNLAYHLQGKEAAEQLAGRMNGVGGLRVRMLPELDSIELARRVRRGEDEAEEENGEGEVEAFLPPAFRHWGQVFDLSHSPSAMSSGQLLPAATRRLTCWGRGEVNIARAPDDVVEETCRATLGPGVARKLVDQYRENPIQNLKQIAMKLKVNERDVNVLRQLVTTESSTYSLWMTSSGANGTRRWFAVAFATEAAFVTERFQF